MEKTVNVSMIKEAVKTHPKFKEALTLLAQRVRGRSDTSLRRVKRLLDEAGKEWSKAEVQQLLEMLQAAGAGHIVFGSTTPRLVWDFHLQSVACAALDLPEPARKTKTGAVIPPSAEGMRKPSRKAPAIPRLVPTPSPVKEAMRASTGKEIVKLRRDGMEVEVNLAEMTPSGCRKLTDMLLSLRKN